METQTKTGLNRKGMKISRMLYLGYYLKTVADRSELKEKPYLASSFQIPQ